MRIGFQLEQSRISIAKIGERFCVITFAWVGWAQSRPNSIPVPAMLLGRADEVIE